MKKFRKPRCPHCGNKIGYMRAWVLKTQGEYLCPKCGAISNIVLDRLAYLLAFLAVLVSAVFFALGMIGLLPVDIWLLLLVFLPFLLFYLIAVFLVRLKKPAVRKRRAPPAGRPPMQSGRTAARSPQPRQTDVQTLESGRIMLKLPLCPYCGATFLYPDVRKSQKNRTGVCPHCGGTFRIHKGAARAVLYTVSLFMLTALNYLLLQVQSINLTVLLAVTVLGVAGVRLLVPYTVRYGPL